MSKRTTSIPNVTETKMLGAMNRAGRYLEECVRFGKERQKAIRNGKERNIRRHNLFLKQANIPEAVWFPLESDLIESQRLDVMAELHYWLEGTLQDFDGVYSKLEEDLDLDVTYILFGIPIQSLSVEAQRRLCKVGKQFACRKLTEMAPLN